jgi:hypothetical protein
MNENMAYCTDSAGLLDLAQHADKNKKNRRANISALAEVIDPNGVHLLVMQMLHNDNEWRTCWYVKVKDQDEPEVLWLDVDLDKLADRLHKRLTFAGALRLLDGAEVPGWNDKE